MSYVVMGRDECGDVFRASDKTWPHGVPHSEVLKIHEEYPEARSIWVEELRDKEFFQSRNQEIYDRDEQDLY